MSRVSPLADAYKGVIIEESLEDKLVLRQLKILRTEIEKVTDHHKTPWLKQWTKHVVEVPEEQAEVVAERLAKAIVPTHKAS